MRRVIRVEDFVDAEIPDAMPVETKLVAYKLHLCWYRTLKGEGWLAKGRPSAYLKGSLGSSSYWLPNWFGIRNIGLQCIAQARINQPRNPLTDSLDVKVDEI